MVNGALSKEKTAIFIFVNFLTLLHSRRPKLYGVLAVLSVIGLMEVNTLQKKYFRVDTILAWQCVQKSKQNITKDFLLCKMIEIKHEDVPMHHITENVKRFKPRISFHIGTNQLGLQVHITKSGTDKAV